MFVVPRDPTRAPVRRAPSFRAILSTSLPPVAFWAACAWAALAPLGAPQAAENRAAAEHAAAKRVADLRAPAVVDEQDRAFLAAHAAAVKRDATAFDAAADQVARTHPLHPYLDYWRLRMSLVDEREQAEEEAEARADTSDLPPGALRQYAPLPPDLEREIRAFIDTHDGSLVAELLRGQYLISLGRRNSWREFRRQFAAWQRRFDTRVFCHHGRANLAAGKPVGEEAMNAFHTDRDLGEDCGALTSELHAAGVLDAQALRARMWLALEHRDYRSVRLLAEKLGVDTARIDAALRQGAVVASTFEPRAKPLSTAERDELLIALVAHSRPKPVETAALADALGDHFNDSERQFVWSQIAASAMRDMLPEAYPYTLRAIDAPISDVTRPWLARAALRQLDWPLLARIIGRMGSPLQSSTTWVYWRARALEGMGSRYGAEALLDKIAGELDFYGQLAGEELGRLVTLPRAAAPVTPADIRAVRKRPGIALALEFFRIGLRFEGNREWNHEVRGLDDRTLLAAATLACAQGLHERCVSTAERTREEHDFGLRFVAPFRADMKAAARARDLDLAWVYGLVRQESRFVADASSSAGARGLMQIMPATGRWIARQLGQRDFRTRQLFDPDVNLSFGTFYLRTVYDDLYNSRVLASAGYNAGPRRPRRWASTLPQDVDGALFVEIIPFNETRDYVKKVLLNTAYYGALLEGKPQSLKRLLGEVRLAPDTPTGVP